MEMSNRSDPTRKTARSYKVYVQQMCEDGTLTVEEFTSDELISFKTDIKVPARATDDTSGQQDDDAECKMITAMDVLDYLQDHALDFSGEVWSDKDRNTRREYVRAWKSFTDHVYDKDPQAAQQNYRPVTTAVLGDAVTPMRVATFAWYIYEEI